MPLYYTRLEVKCDPGFSEILMAELAELGFESFLENETGFEAYVEGERYGKDSLQEVREKYLPLTTIEFQFDQIEKKNWNEEWEKNYEPIIVDDRCLIRADFHRIDKKYQYEIIITPKMSFGTGHHQTTYLMIKSQMSIDHKHKQVMDAGCGTAILSVMACKLGASHVDAFDIDEWSVINGNENIAINGCPDISLQQGKIDEVQLRDRYDIILANINKNVLLEEMKKYVTFLSPGGLLLLSGFYTKDIPDLLTEAWKYNLTEARRDERETWASLLLTLG